MRLITVITAVLILSLAASAINVTLSSDSETTNYLAQNKNWFFANSTAFVNQASCLQQTPNTVEANCGLATGSYTGFGVWTWESNCFDGLYTTYGYAHDTAVYLYINYTKPVGVSSVIWSLAGGNGEYAINNATNYTIPNYCFSYSLANIQLRVNGSTSGTNFAWCMNASGWVSLGSFGSGNRLYEEAVYWTFVRAVDTLYFTMNSSNYSFIDPSLILGLNLNNASFLLENDTSVVDFTNGIRATVVGGNFTTPNGKYRRGMQFDGLNDYIYIPSINSTQITFSAWVYATLPSAAVERIIAEKWFTPTASQSWLLDIQTDNRLLFKLRTDTTTSDVYTTAPISFNQWFHVTITYDGITQSIYINGILNNSSPLAGSIQQTPTNIFIGTYDASFDFFNGTIDEVRIWNRSLTQAEINAQYWGNVERVTLTNYTTKLNTSGLYQWNYTYSFWVNDSTGLNSKSDTRRIKFNEATQLTNCSAGSNSTVKSLQFFHVDATTGLNITPSNINFYGLVTSQDGSVGSYNFSTTTAGNLTMCLYPSWSVATAYALMSYSANNYTNGTYVYSGAVTNSTFNVTMGDLPLTSDYALTLIYVLDSTNRPAIGAVVQIYYEDTISGNKTLINSIITDSEGKGTAFLIPNGPTYSFNITYEGMTAFISPTVVTCSSGSCPPYTLTLRISIQPPADFYKYMNLIQHHCFLTANTSIFNCSISSNAPNLYVYAELRVGVQTLLGFSTLCLSNSTAQSAMLSCDLANTTNQIYSWTLSVHDSAGGAYLIESGLLDFTQAGMNWGVDGIYVTFLLVGIMFLIGAWNVSVAIIFGYLGVVMSYLLGLFKLPLGVGFEAITALGVVVAILVYLLRS